MKVGISYWGFCEDASLVANTPDGHRYGRPILVNALASRGHEVIALQQRRELTPYPTLVYSSGFPDLDILFIEWRWPTYKNSGDNKFEPDLDRQIELLDFYHEKGIPIVAWDTDLKMTSSDEQRWPNMIVADPTLDPKSFYIPRVRMTFWSDFKDLFPVYNEGVELGYIGNNYERDEMFKKYYSEPAAGLRDHGIQTKVWGNWLQRSPERNPPEQLIRSNPHVAFSDRVSFNESMFLLNKFICTVHITKPRYATQGFCSPRYLENLVVNTPALVPKEFACSTILGKEWEVGTLLDVVNATRKIKKLSSDDRRSVVLQQREDLLKVHDFSVDYVCEFLESSAHSPVSAVRSRG